MITRSTCFLLFIVAVLETFAQKLPEKGMPSLDNFMPQLYQNKGKIWDIQSADNGVVYMAADLGLIEYDGKSWNSFSGSTGNTRSLLIKNDSVIYTGSDLDFGVWKRNNYQAFEYTSLYPFDQDLIELNEEFWAIHQLQDNIIFVSAQNIYIFKDNQFTKISAPNRFTGSYAVNDTLYFADEQTGLYVFNHLSLKQIGTFPEGMGTHISGMYSHNQELIVVTRDSGLYRYSEGQLKPVMNSLSRILTNAKVFSFETINDTYLAFGTVLKGLYITDMQGTIIHQINKNKGLPNNTILSQHYSPAGALWIGMDFGVSALNLKDNHTYFYDFRGDYGTAYTAWVKDGIFYLGTNQGLYQSQWEDLNNDSDFHNFQLIKGTEGQVWTLKNSNNTLLMGHDQGLFRIEGTRAEQIAVLQGVWTITPYKDYLLTGNYNGISLFKKSDNEWSFLKKMKLILGSCNQLIVEKDNILWVNIPNFGIIRAVLDDELNPIERSIFPKNQFEGNNIYMIRDEQGLHILTDNYQYTYNATEKQFLNKTTPVDPPTVENILPGVYESSPLHAEYDFYPIYNGFALKYLHDTHILGVENQTIILREMEAFNNDDNDVYFSGAKIPYALNNLRIDFLVPNQANVVYQYAINDSGKWSAWDPDNSLLLSGLRNGEYKLLVRAQINDKVTEPLIVSFTIAAPWFRSWYAWVSYVLLLVGVFYIIYEWQKIVLKKQKKALLIRQQISLREQAEKYRHHIMQLQQEQLQSEYDQLKQQLKNKTIELANKARDNEEQNRLLITLKEKCQKAQQLSSTTKMRWSEIQKLIDKQITVEDKTFEIQMDELHQALFRKLKKQHPDLSANDLRLCAYIKIGLNSKEIADILNIQPSSAYISRSRLRKKLNLKPEEDLYDYLNAMDK